MSGHLLLVVMVIYAYVAVSYFMAGRAGMGLAFLAYSIANLGFVVDLIENGK